MESCATNHGGRPPSSKHIDIASIKPGKQLTNLERSAETAQILPQPAGAKLDLDAELKKRLKESYFTYRQVEFERQTGHVWDSRRLMFVLNSLTPQIPQSWELAHFCNKPTMLYWTPAAQENGCCRVWTYNCIVREWFRYGQPVIEYGHFFANPIRVTSSGPSSISGILAAHQSLYDQASSLLGQIERGEIEKPYGSVWPDTGKFTLHPLCQTVIVILDELPPEQDLAAHEMSYEDEMDEELQRQSVILVRTGKDISLSKPISFESIRMHSLPLARLDCSATDAGINVIRVPLGIAVRFIADLERREEAAFPKVRSTTNAVDGSICPNAITHGPVIREPDEWVTEILKQATEKGPENVYEVKAALRDIRTTSQTNITAAR